MESQFVVCGLGNPGQRYALTRHNMGFHLADALAERHRARWSFADPRSARARVRIAGHDALLIKPLTWMNLSGEALEPLREREQLAHLLLVACDDIALPPGTLRLRPRGSDGGHNGLKSVIETLGTAAFVRLRMGVGAPPEGVDAADYVLEPMDGDTVALTQKMVREAVRCVETWLEEGVTAAMNRFNRRGDTVAGEEGERD